MGISRSLLLVAHDRAGPALIALANFALDIPRLQFVQENLKGRLFGPANPDPRQHLLGFCYRST